jgi:high-affinity iron transporter
MLAPFLIVLREGIEAALIVGIIASYLRQTGAGHLLPFVVIGVMLAVALSLFTGAGILALNTDFPQKTQELFEAIIGFIAVGMLTWMVFWMRTAAQTISQRLKHQVGVAVTAPKGAGWMLVSLSFFAVAREGLETIFFLLAIFQQSQNQYIPAAALAGLLLSIVIGMAIFRFGAKIPLQSFFRWTSLFILVVAAGLLANALRSLHEAGLWNWLQTTAFDFSMSLPSSSTLGTILSGLIGYCEAPTIGEFGIWALYLIVTLVIYFGLSPSAVANKKVAP